MRRILHELGESVIDLSNLFLGDPERDGGTRPTFVDAALRLGFFLGASALIVWLTSDYF